MDIEASVKEVHRFKISDGRFCIVQSFGSGGLRAFLTSGYGVDGHVHELPVGGVETAMLRELAALATTAARDRADCDTARATRDAAIGRALAAEARPGLLLVDPQPSWIPSSGRWSWPIPDHLVHEGCCKSVCTASREWFEYLQEDQKPHPGAGVVQYGDAWYWVIPGQSAPSENLADGSRTFQHNGIEWRIWFTDGGAAQLLRSTDRGPLSVGLHDSSAPHFQVLAREFAALGREREAARIDPLLRQARDEASRLREESQRNAGEHAEALRRAHNLAGSRGTLLTEASRQNDVARERIAELEAHLDRLIFRPSEASERTGLRVPSLREFDSLGDRFQIRILSGGFSVLKWRPTGWLAIDHDYDKGAPDADQLIENFIALAEERADCRLHTEVADLTAKLEEQKARADKAEARHGAAHTRGLELVDESIRHQNEARSQRSRADGYADAFAKAGEGMQIQARIIRDLNRKLADIEDRQVSTFENLATGCIAAVRARTEGDPRRVVSLQSDEAGLWLTLADGSAWHSRCHPSPEWKRIPLPPVEPEIEIGAEEPGELLEPRSFAADVPACWLPAALRERLRAVVKDYGVKVPAREKNQCERCGFWEAAEAGPVGGLCAKCDHDIEAERGA